MWGCYDPIGLDPSDPKKWGLYGCSVKKNQIFGPKMLFFGPKSIFFQTLSKIFVTIMTGHLKDNIFVLSQLFFKIHMNQKKARGTDQIVYLAHLCFLKLVTNQQETAL